MHETLMYLAMGFGMIVAAILLITTIIVVSKWIECKFGLTLKLQFELLLGLAIVGVLIYYVTNNTSAINDGLNEMSNYIDNNFLNDLSVVLKHLFVSELEVLMILTSLASGYILNIILSKFNSDIDDFFYQALSISLFTINFYQILQINYYNSRILGTVLFLYMMLVTFIEYVLIWGYFDDKREEKKKEEKNA